MLFSVRHLHGLDRAGIIAGSLFIYYGVTSFIEHRNPALAGPHLLIGVLFALACMAVFGIHGRQQRDGDKHKTARGALILVTLGTIPICYPLSYAYYLKAGRTLGTVLGVIAGASLGSGMRVRLPGKVNSVLAAMLLGLCIFFVLQDTALDVMTMASDALAPRISRGEKVWVNKAIALNVTVDSEC